ncbi:MAG: endopeptidase La [Eubacteriales bacterium]|nr:endopeptidase La [Eubacteriales bacterium]
MTKVELTHLPLVVLKGLVPFPGCVIQIDVHNEHSIRSVEEAAKDGEPLVMVMFREGHDDTVSKQSLHVHGVTASVEQYIRLPDKTLRVVFATESKVEIKKVYEQDDIYRVDVRFIEEEVAEELYDEYRLDGLRSILQDTLNEFSERIKLKADINLKAQDFNRLIAQVCLNLPVGPEKRQELLAENTVMGRFRRLNHLLHHEMYVMDIKKEINDKVKERLDKNQREYVLKEQIQVIREELGDVDPISEHDNYMKKLDEADMPAEIKEKVAEEIGRLKSYSAMSQESAILKNYLDTVFDYPWNKRSKDDVELTKAKQILEADHYGLQKVKERILEFISVRQFNPDGKSPIICLVGPPGTGKTSIASSIATALNKELVRIALGGVRDESEIRGHRRTYLGAMPGRLVKAMIQAKVENPVILFDEIDKLGADYKGDPSSALLEVLDGAQNHSFRDNYLELPVDLSRVFFITTANTLATIPAPLLDRMDVIEVNSYTDNEKFHIAKQYLYKKQLNAYGMTKSQVNITDEALRMMIQQYVLEAGVRRLERTIAKVIRKGAKYLLEHDQKTLSISKRNLQEFLGNPKYVEDSVNKVDQVGIVHGLAWTSVGGCTLQIEVNCMPGKGRLELTGQLGDVMKESAVIARSYIRSIKGKYKVKSSFFDENDIHVHIPEGAVPKDGPSAGITMASAMLSAIMDKPAKANLCMTGEVTLRGRVLPIGGLKEKLLAAKNAKITNVLVPFDNKRDVAEIDEEITDGLTIRFVKNMNDVLKYVFSEA